MTTDSGLYQIITYTQMIVPMGILIVGGVLAWRGSWRTSIVLVFLVSAAISILAILELEPGAQARGHFEGFWSQLGAWWSLGGPAVPIFFIVAGVVEVGVVLGIRRATTQRGR